MRSSTTNKAEHRSSAGLMVSRGGLVLVLLLGVAEARSYAETLSVPSEDEAGVWTSPLQAGTWYLIQVSGIWYRDATHVADAEWYEPEPGDPWQEEYPEYPGLLDLQINGVSPDWMGTADGILFARHTYSPSHVYRLWYLGTGDPIRLAIYDDHYSTNSGFLTVTIVEDLGTVTVGNHGNDGELSGAGVGGAGPERICGAVDHEYNIGIHEVTAGQYIEFLNAVAVEDSHELYNPSMDEDPYGCQITRHANSEGYWYDFSGGTVEAPESTEADWANRPVNYVSWGDAARFCNWLHRGKPSGPQCMHTTESGSYYLNGAMTDADLMAIVREDVATWVIPSEDEWYKAAYHKNDGITVNYWNYPTGTDASPDNGNPDDGSPLVDSGNTANYLDYEDFTIGSPHWRTDVGTFGLSGSPCGTFDQGGNLYEWNAEILNGVHRGVRGGSFGNNAVTVMHAAYRADSYPPSYESAFIGFRVAAINDQDCNGNGVLDAWDIASGTSDDGNTNGVPDECEPRISTGRSCRTHGEQGMFCLEIGSAEGCCDASETPEMRLGGALRVELDLGVPMDAASVIGEHVQVDCGEHAYEGPVSAWLVDAATVALILEAALPGGACCEISLEGMISTRDYAVINSYSVATLGGDTNQDGIVSTLDYSAVKARFGQATTADNFRWDVNADGIINSIDASGIKARFGNSAPSCP